MGTPSTPSSGDKNDSFEPGIKYRHTGTNDWKRAGASYPLCVWVPFHLDCPDVDIAAISIGHTTSGNSLQS